MPADRPPTSPPAGWAQFAGVRASEPVECVDLLDEPDRVAAGGWWAVVGTFEGRILAWRFAKVETPSSSVDEGAPAGKDAPTGEGKRPWRGPYPASWQTSMSAADYAEAVAATREAIRAGEVYQANICRVMSAPLPAVAAEPDAAALAGTLAAGNPAPFAGVVHVPRGGPLPPVWLVSASPELYLRLEGGVLSSGPIKGTATAAELLTEKDRAENVMITDLVRNDLQQVCLPGTVSVTELLAVQAHPGLVHLVSTVAGRLDPGVAGAPGLWGRVLGATFPPGSVSGAPKSSALRIIARLEPVPRGPYCGTVGWIDADRGRAELAVAIRTFWWTDDDGGRLHFGTGAGITWGSDPAREWEETELKARRLVALASGAEPVGPDWNP